MAYDLAKLKQPEDEKRGSLFVFYGEAGMGKTALGATFKNPVFIRIEDGVETLKKNPNFKDNDIRMFPVVTSRHDVKEQLESLITQEHGFKSVVIDSISQLDVILQREIVEEDGASSIATALKGYGNGFLASADRHGEIRAIVDKILGRGINVVALCHAESETIDPPDQEPYSKYTLRLHKKAVKHWTDYSDLVGFLKLKTVLRGSDGSKKAISTGKRVLSCHAVANSVSKNRLKIKEEILLEEGVNPFSRKVKEEVITTEEIK